jgi:hypothetical protein
MRYVSCPPGLTSDPARLVAEFPKWLEKVSSRMPAGIILAIDSVDCFQVRCYPSWKFNFVCSQFRNIVTQRLICCLQPIGTCVAIPCYWTFCQKTCALLKTVKTTGFFPLFVSEMWEPSILVGGSSACWSACYTNYSAGNLSTDLEVSLCIWQQLFLNQTVAIWKFARISLLCRCWLILLPSYASFFWWTP